MGKQILLYSILGILGSWCVIQGGRQALKGWDAKLNEKLQSRAEEFFFPNLTQMERQKDRNLGEWIVAQAMNIMPLGKYVVAKAEKHYEVEDQMTKEMILKAQAKDENEVDENGNLINHTGETVPEVPKEIVQGGLDTSMEMLRDFDYLLSNFYTVDSTTMIDSNQLNPEVLLGANMKINKAAAGPKVLVFHTHSQETFIDSTPGDPTTSIVGIGTYLTEKLNEKGIAAIHDEGIYDIIEGKLDRSKAYECSEVGVRQILAENPSVEVVIDLHRDGVKSETHLLSDINGKQTAKIMFFNGLSRTRTNGDIAYLQNPYIQDNLAFSLQMQIAAENKYPGFARHIYLKGYRYSLHMMPKSLLIEAGAQTNTVAEMKNAMDALSDILYHVLAE